MDRYLKRLQDALLSATDGISPQALMRHPEGKWSSAEILEHLYFTYSNTAKGFAKCLEAGKPLAGSLTLKQRLPIAVVTILGYLPEGRQSPERVRPRGTAAETVVKEIGPQIEEMDKLISEAERRYGRNTRLMDHPVLGPLTGKQWRKFHLVHGEHHVKQIERLRKLD